MHETYLWVKALHIIAVISWMAGMLYLPRLFVYHAGVSPGSEASEMLKTMEHRLLRYIINPAMIATWGFGLWLAVILNAFSPGNGGWMHAKLALVLALSAMHGYFSSCRKRFARDANEKSPRFFKIINEVITLMMVGIVLIVVLKPF